MITLLGDWWRIGSSTSPRPFSATERRRAEWSNTTTISAPARLVDGDDTPVADRVDVGDVADLDLFADAHWERDLGRRSREVADVTHADGLRAVLDAQAVVGDRDQRGVSALDAIEVPLPDVDQHLTGPALRGLQRLEHDRARLGHVPRVKEPRLLAGDDRLDLADQPVADAQSHEQDRRTAALADDADPADLSAAAVFDVGVVVVGHGGRGGPEALAEREPLPVLGEPHIAVQRQPGRVTGGERAKVAARASRSGRLAPPSLRFRPRAPSAAP